MPMEFLPRHWKRTRNGERKKNTTIGSYIQIADKLLKRNAAIEKSYNLPRTLWDAAVSAVVMKISRFQFTEPHGFSRPNLLIRAGSHVFSCVLVFWHKRTSYLRNSLFNAFLLLLVSWIKSFAQRRLKFLKSRTIPRFDLIIIFFSLKHSFSSRSFLLSFLVIL